MKKLGILLLTCLLAVGLVGCGGDNKNDSASTDNTELSGKVSLDGSTSMEKFVNGLKEAMAEKYPNLLLEPQFTGSGTGIQSCIAGTADIGNSSRALKDEEKAQGLVENIVAIDGIAVVVDKNNTIGGVTKDQLIKIYTGQIKNWKEINGKDQKIVVIGREASSGTRGAFEEILDVEEKCQYAQELNETGAVMAAVAATPGAIGYVSLDNVDDSVIALQLDGVAPSEETVKDGTYALQRPFVMATKGSIEEQSEQVKAIFDFIDSEEGQKVIKAVGLVSPK